jgi:hypothetical protein
VTFDLVMAAIGFLLAAYSLYRNHYRKEKSVARSTQRVVRTRSIEDLADDEYDAIIKGLQVIVEVNEKAPEDDEDELDEPTKEYPAAKRLLAALESSGEVITNVPITMPMPGVAMSSDDPRGGPDDPVGMPSRSPSGTGGGPFTRRPRE